MILRIGIFLLLVPIANSGIIDTSTTSGSISNNEECKNVVDRDTYESNSSELTATIDIGNCNASTTTGEEVDNLNDQGNGDDDDNHFITESTYTPPKKNHTAPASRSTTNLGNDLGVIQQLDATYADKIFDRIEMARDYVQSVVMREPKFENVRHLCQNKHNNCAFWSVLGECENNPGYMNINCAPVCRSCDLLHTDTRCQLDPNAIDSLRPGDLNKLFDNIVTNPEFQQYEPVILSQPPNGPWMVMFENIISDIEAERLIELGGIQGYERSSDVGSKQDDGTYGKNVNNGRTSTNAWCIDNCYEDPVAKTIVGRIENITGIPETNQENLQLLRYDVGQYYQRHSDFIPHLVDRPCGVRTLTFYMYLNDVEEGGGTSFPQLEKTVTPKRGRAVLWPSVLDEDPHRIDPRTQHTALKVIKGVKYGANAWIHMRDFKTANLNGCAS